MREATSTTSGGGGGVLWWSRAKATVTSDSYSVDGSAVTPTRLDPRLKQVASEESESSLDEGDMHRRRPDEDSTNNESSMIIAPQLELLQRPTNTPAAAELSPLGLEGLLLCRKGKSSGHSSLLWKRRFVILSLQDGGSITVYKEQKPHSNSHSGSTSKSLQSDPSMESALSLGSPSSSIGQGRPYRSSTIFKSVYTTLQKHSVSPTSSSTSGSARNSPTLSTTSSANASHASINKSSPQPKRRISVMDLYIPSHVDWVAKDVDHDPDAFVIEIPTLILPGSRNGGSSTLPVREPLCAVTEVDNETTPIASGGTGTRKTPERTYSPGGVTRTASSISTLPIIGEDPVETSHNSTTLHVRNTSMNGQTSSGAFSNGGVGSTLTISEDGSTMHGDNDNDDGAIQEVKQNTRSSAQRSVGFADANGQPLESFTPPRKGSYSQNGSVTKGNPIFRNPFAEDADLILLADDLGQARSKGKPLRIYFRCHKGGSNEKGLWLRAFARLDRLSSDVRKKKTILSVLASPLNLVGHHTRANRTRNQMTSNIARDTRELDLLEEQSGQLIPVPDAEMETLHITNDVEGLLRGKSSKKLQGKEFRVFPSYAYPHRWMTRQEMREEMMMTSTEFHDLRVPGFNLKEIGSLRVEVLQCLGLPKVYRNVDPDAVVYLVCGQYAFSTDVIPNRSNPMWLRKSRRACDIPLFHAYARLYVGVFDDEGKRIKDDFAGRVVIDLARLRPNSAYDVTLPLRLSAHVYSRRRRGAVRLRFTLSWKSERDAMLSYIPRRIRIPLPEHSKPHHDVTVACADAKAFHNIAITVHGAHLPGRFTFPQMRATIREINFTRKFIFLVIRLEIQATIRWQIPAVSAFCFLSWMHCIYANAFSLCPAYIVLYFLLFLMRMYVKYNMDGPFQRGFVPPSWEEMFMALVSKGDDKVIEPLELGFRPVPVARRRHADMLLDSQVSAERFDYQVTTHVPAGKSFFRAIGIIPDQNQSSNSADQDHLEFPFANFAGYPKFGVKECLVFKKGDEANAQKNNSNSNSINSKDTTSMDMEMDDSDNFHVTTDANGEIRMVPRGAFSSLDARRPSKDYDEEESNFAPRHAVMASGKMAANTLTQAATDFTRGTGIKHVVSPIRSGLSSGMNSMQEFRQAAVNLNPAMRRAHSIDSDMTDVMTDVPSLNSNSNSKVNPMTISEIADAADGTSLHSDEDELNEIGDADVTDEVDPASVWPEQDIDIEGPSTGKKITDDLEEVKDKMHELFWHLFDDTTYTLKNPSACYFGEAKKPEKRRKGDVSRQLDKLLQIGQYSHPNPLVARVGLYVEPIIGSAYSFLCFFRASFNLLTWRDPILTFWFSLLVALLAIILFIFPWRIFLFVVGVAVLGPQNWAVRVLRERGHLPPAKKRVKRKEEEAVEPELFAANQPIFASQIKHQEKVAPTAPTDIDPREVHRVVIPYSPLLYQRFYDWPPEPQYAQVKPVIAEESKQSGKDAPLKAARAQAEILAKQKIAAEIRQRRFQQHRRGISASTQESPMKKSSMSSDSNSISSNSTGGSKRSKAKKLLASLPFKND